MERAAKVWKDQLVDLGGRNTLLYYKDLKQGTLDLSADRAHTLGVQQLLAGSTVRLSNLFDPSDLPAAAKRARTVAAKATENFEERGLTTLHLAWGMATWTTQSSTATPAAPILLTEATLVSRGRTGDDYDVSLPGEWAVNPTLLHLLATDYHVSVDPDEVVSLLDTAGNSGLDAQPVFDRLVKLAKVVEDFRVDDRVVLGNFSYAKLPMVRDLDLVLSNGELLEHDLLVAIAGDASAATALKNRHPEVTPDEPDRLPPADEFLVLDADSSQSYVINAVTRGGDLVVEGPPGTGKSQTIANLIASLSARGKSTLFVAEKRAAIDAVLERLQARDLGGLVLDLHDGVSSRRKIAQDLAKALDTSRSIALQDHSELHGRLTRRRESLRAWNDALHKRRDPWNLSVYEAQAAMLELRGIDLGGAKLSRDVARRLGDSQCRQAKVDLERFVETDGLPLAAGSAPWSRTFQGRHITTMAQATSAREALERLDAAVGRTQASVGALASVVGLRAPVDLEEITSLLRAIARVRDLLERYDASIFAEAESLAASLEPGGGGGGRRLLAGLGNSEYRAARRRMTELAGGRKDSASAQADDASTARELAVWWAATSANGSIPQATDAASAAAEAEQLAAGLDTCARLTGIDDLADERLVELSELLGELLRDQATLVRLPELDELAQRLHSHELWPLVFEAAQRGLGSEEAVRLLHAAWLDGFLDCVAIADAAVGGFSGAAHDQATADFRKADAEHIQQTPARVLRAVAERLVEAQNSHPEQAKLIHREASKKQRHIPIRTLVHEASDVLTALKPCWAMSPLVVAQVLPPEKLFDVVIFDEASQVMPADAVGALLRADRAIVAGDSKQLPPTSFFAASTGGGEDDEDLEDEYFADGGVELTRDIESILEVMRVLLPPPLGTKTLEWHYRSQDERLIAFSNAQASLYDWSLTTFPGAGIDRPLRHEAIPWAPGRVGQEQSASEEVERVVELIIEHAEERPHESLGVIAMGIKHANRIEERLRQVRLARPDLDDALQAGPAGLARPEPLFVKNLERVQGDERDAIILTIGYGKNADGRMMYRFGPLNQQGGERRLNVAITRARRRMTVVSSFVSSDLDPNRMRAEGAQMLYRYLQYVESAGSHLGDQARVRPDLNPFERDVRDALTAAGVPLVAQLGASGYWIDFAAQHPEQPGRMVLAIEADGATYHSSATARDRDRLRQEHLERLGWTFHRIWSTDWFHRRDAEIQRAVDAWRAAVQAADRGAEEDRSPASAVRTPKPAVPSATSAAPRSASKPGFRPGRPIGEYSASTLRALAIWVQSDTLLRTTDEVVAEMMKELGFKKRGKNIVAALEQAIESSRT